MSLSEELGTLGSPCNLEPVQTSALSIISIQLPSEVVVVKCAGGVDKNIVESWHLEGNVISSSFVTAERTSAVLLPLVSGNTSSAACYSPSPARNVNYTNFPHIYLLTKLSSSPLRHH